LCNLPGLLFDYRLLEMTLSAQNQKILEPALRRAGSKLHFCYIFFSQNSPKIDFCMT